VEYNGHTFNPGQGNNAYIFPGIALGVIAAGMHHISEKVFLLSAQTLAELVTDEHLKDGRVYPPLQTITDCSIKIATRLLEYAYQERIASHYPEPKDKEEYVRSQMYNYNYRDSLPCMYDWPEHTYKQ
jgi:malate dehydrogenase (oxaloacetate-decarboxylating)(NADP+)